MHPLKIWIIKVTFSLVIKRESQASTRSPFHVIDYFSYLNLIAFLTTTLLNDFFKLKKDLIISVFYYIRALGDFNNNSIFRSGPDVNFYMKFLLI